MDKLENYTAHSNPASVKITDDNSFLKAAVHYCALGWNVFPVWGIKEVGTNGTRKLNCRCYAASKCASPGKHPMHKNWQKKASNNMEAVKGWDWAGCNIGILTGKPSDLYVIDCDVKNDGLENFNKWEHDNVPLHTEFRVITGSGGMHFYFNYPEGFEDLGNKTGVLEGVDIRADGGFVVAPPSLHISGGRYEWEL